MKRKAPFELEREQIEKGQYSDEEGDKPDLGKISTPQEISKRKILKIKGLKPQAQQQESKEVKFSLKANLQNVECPPEQEKQTFSFIKNEKQPETQEKKANLFDNSSVNQKVEEGQKVGKPVEISDSEKMKVAQNLEDIAAGKAQIKSSGLFNNNAAAKTTEEEKPEEKPATGGLFANVSQNKPASGGLFANVSSGSQSGGLFGNNANKTEEKSSGLFGQSSIFNQQNKPASGGLFSGVINQDQKKTEGGSIFGNFNQNNQQSGGLFGGNAPAQQQQSGGLFSGVKPAAQPTTGLFSGVQAPAKQGGLNLGIPANNEEEEENDEDDGAVSGQSTPEIDRAKAQKFEYKSEMEKLQNKPVNKFRKNQNDIQEKGFASIERKSGQDNAMSVIIYRNQLKQIIYQGYLMKQLSSVKILNNKEENLLVQAINQEKKEDGSTKFIKDNLKIQFTSAVEGAEFKSTLEDLLK